MIKRSIKILITATLIILIGCIAAFADTPPATDSYEKCKVFVNDIPVSDVAYTLKGNLYISVETLQKYGQTDFMSFDKSNKVVNFNASDLELFIADAETSEFIKNYAGEISLPLKYFYSTYHISLASVTQLCKLSYYYEDHNIYLYPLRDDAHIGAASDSKTAAVGQTVILEDGSRVVISGETSDSYKVSDSRGNTAYVKKSEIKLSDGKVDNIIRYPSTKDVFDKKINMLWQMTTTVTPLAPEEKGIDVMSPIWLRLDKDGKGKVSSICDPGYVELCHANGIKVWVCANNNFDVSGGAKYSRSVLLDEDMMKRSVAQYLIQTVLCGADGINIDYESIGTVNDQPEVPKVAFTKFITLLNEHCEKLGLTLSIATMPALPYWIRSYDFAELGRNSDYLCPMTYNESYSLQTAGSTMSLPYYTELTNNLIELVGKEKVLMGVPFYTQLWKIDKETGKMEAGQDSGATITMKASFNLLDKYGAVMEWSSSAGQYIAKYWNERGNISMMWLEEERSMATKLNYVLESDIAGTACWAYGQQIDGFMEVFDLVYNQGVDPLSIKGRWPDVPEIPFGTEESTEEGTETAEDAGL